MGCSQWCRDRIYTFSILIIGAVLTTLFSYLSEGIIYKSLKKYEQAINDYNTAIKLDSKEPVYYFNRGLTYEEWQHYKEAKKDFEKALKLNPNYEKAKKGIERITNAMKKK